MDIDNGMTTIQAQLPDGSMASWSMDVLGAYRRVNAVKVKLEKEPDADQFAHLDTFKKLVKDAGGPDLNDSQADKLYAAMIEEYACFFVEREARLKLMQTLPSSMASIRSDSPPSSSTGSNATSPGWRPDGFDAPLSPMHGR
jgi:hypothetical protein